MTWVNLESDQGFGPDHLPYGVFERRDRSSGARCGMRIGPRVLDVSSVKSPEDRGWARLFAEPSLNRFMAAGPAVWAKARSSVRTWLMDPTWRDRVEPHLHHLDAVILHLPFEPADYVDFYASEYHATNVGRIFRPSGPPLPPNWKHLPIGYHGRAGTVVGSGTPIVRPSGQHLLSSDPAPSFGPSRRLDIEAEVGFVIGTPSQLGHPVDHDAALAHVFGVVLLNDWSARDIQSWEYVPLGPFLGKSFATSISQWITPLAALAAAWIKPPVRTHRLLPYLEDTGSRYSLDINLRVELNSATISRPRLSAMYWTLPQMVAHLTANGASLRTGDLLGSGTISGPNRDEWGSLLELSWNGDKPIPHAGQRPARDERTFLQDGDEVVLAGRAPGMGAAYISLGEVRGRILPSTPDALA